MKKFLTLVFILSISRLSAQNKFIPDSLESYIAQAMEKWNIPGMAVSVVQNGKIIFMKGFGVREAGKSGSVNEHTLFQIASNTKAFTATALALLEHEKRLSLNDKITRYMQDFRLSDELATREVTIRDMLCHRIGFQTFQSDIFNWNCILPRKDIIHNMRNVRPVHSFRSRYGYCNACYVTAGEIIPIVADTSWDDFLKYNFFQPLEMMRTSTTQAAIIKDDNAAMPHTVFNERLQIIDYDFIDNVGPCASMNSSVNDISNWIIMQLDSGRFKNRQIVPFDVIKKTRVSHTIVRDSHDTLFRSKHFQTYGLGWALKDYNGKLIISHNGGANGFVTNTTLIPELNFGFTVLTNTDANDLYIALGDQLIDAAFNLPFRNYSDMYYAKYKQESGKENERIRQLWDKAAKNPNPALPLKSYAGKYSNNVYKEIEIKQEKDNLVIYFPYHPGLTGKLQPLGENNFVCTYSKPGYGVKEIPFEVKDGKVSTVTIQVNDFIDFLPYIFTKQNP